MSRLEIEGMLHRLKMQRMDLATKADVKIRAIKQILSMSAITPINEIDVEGVYTLADEICGLKQQMIKNLDDAKKLEKELHG